MAAFLVLQAARFGDLVQSKRLIRTLESRGQVHLGVEAGLASLARLLYPTAEIHALNLHARPEHKALEHNRKILTQWRAADFQAVYNCNFSGMTAALCRCFEPGLVHGYRPSPGGILRSAWARKAFRLSERRVLSPLNLVDFWAHFTRSPVAADQVNPQATPGGQGLGVVLAGRESRRSLPVPVLAAVLETAFKALDGPPIRLLGSKAEQAAARKLLRLLPPRIQEQTTDLSGKTDWPGLVDAVRGLDGLITPDTGIMHLAAHLGVPVLAFFLSSASAHETGPYGRGHFVWQAARACAPCLESAPCPHGTACLAPFRESELLRSLAVCLRGETGSQPPLPDGLQLWQSDLDALGCVLRLQAGSDPWARQRAAVRAALAEFLRLPEAFGELFGASAPTAENAPDPAGPDDWLCKDLDWMLPPGRYC